MSFSRILKIHSALLKDKEQLDDKYQCPLCRHLLKDAVQTSCGHWLCNDCADDMFKKNLLPNCPRDDCGEALVKEDGRSFFPDRFVRKEINRFPMVCVNTKFGCGWIGTVGKLEEHLPNCQFDKKECPHCKKLFFSTEIATHVTTHDFANLLTRLIDADSSSQDLEEFYSKSCPPCYQLLCEKLEEAIALKKQLEELKSTTHNGQFTWKIPDIKRKCHRCTPLYSPPFYTSKQEGYKMCLCVYFNGDGIGSGTHLSLSFIVMRGDYDDLLKWPFKQPVIVLLCNLKYPNNSIKHNYSFDPSMPSTDLSSPIANDGMNIVYSCSLFAPLSVLANPDFIGENDSLFIKCKVDLKGLEDH